MSVWDVEDAALAELGPKVGAMPAVSHCYRRPRRLPGWPYNLFAMVHGRTRAAVETEVAAIARLLGAACRRHEVLYSTAILKKTGLRLGE
jgi:DNA-binding Lrp family transcriptional regulator